MAGSMLVLFALALSGPRALVEVSSAAPQPARQSQIAHETRVVAGHAGTQLFQQRWRPAGEVRGVLFVMHGLGDHSGRYDELARRLAASGIAVYGLDHRGFGKSTGVRGQIDAFASVLADVDTLVAWADEEPASAPRFMFGHSMGGAIATRYVLDHEAAFAGLVLSGAALTTAELPAKRVALIRKLSAKRPDLRVLAVKPRQFSHDRAMVHAMRHDPLIDHHKVPVRTVAEVIGAVEDIEARRSGMKTPMLVMHGAEDRVTPVAGSRALVEHAASTDKTLRVLDGMRHDVTHEIGRDDVISEIQAWIVERAVSRAAAVPPAS